MSTGSFNFDVFLCYNSRDKAIVHPLAKRLEEDGLHVWLDVWQVKPGDNILAKIEEGLERSSVLVFCMSEDSLGSGWATLENYTFRFRDPLNKDRRFIPLRLDDSPLKGTLSQFAFIDWRGQRKDVEYDRLLEACRHGRLDRFSETIKEPASRQLQERAGSLGHTERIHSVALSTDGKRALSGSEDNTVRLWDVESSCSLVVFEGHFAGVLSVALSSDGNCALSGSADYTLRLWDVKSGHPLRIFDGHTKSVLSVVLSLDGKRALSGSADCTLRLWDVESGRCVRVFDGHANSVLCVALSADGKRALSGSADYTVRLWDVESGDLLLIFDGHNGSVRSVAFSSNGKRAFSGSEDKTLRLWDVEGGCALRVFERQPLEIWSVALSADGKRALSGSADDAVRLWDVESGRCLRVFEGHTGSVWSVVLSADGKRFLSGSGDRTLRLWDLKSGRPLRVINGHTNPVLSVAFSTNGKTILSGSTDKTLQLADRESGRTLQVFRGHTDSVLSVALSADGKRALSGSEDKTLRVWDVKSGHALQVFEGHMGAVWSVALSADGKRALSGSADSTLRVWDVKSGHALQVFEGHTGAIWSVALSVDSKQVLSGSVDKTLRVWDVESGRALHVFEGHTGRVWSVAFSEDGKRALSGSEDKTLRVWDVESGRPLHIFEGHMGSVWSVAFSSDGKFALSGSEDKTLRVWDVESGRALQVLEGHSATVCSVCFDRARSRAFSGAANGVWRSWNLSGIEVSTIVSRQTTPTIAEFQYSNAKILFVGDSGVGKTGLLRYLVLGIKDKEHNSSTDGVWATHWSLPRVRSEEGIQREIWLWDFAGQVDYRLVQQLFMDGTAAAVLVFNPQNENPFEVLGQWDRALQKSTRKPFAKLLAAGRIDRGGLVVSRASVHRFMEERGFMKPLYETSAKTGQGCEKLREGIISAVPWQNIPTTTSPVLYQRLKQEVLEIRDKSPVLIRFAELKQRMQMKLLGENFKLEELETVVDLLSGPGIIQKLNFGEFILLRPEILSRYAAAVVRQVRTHPQELGCISEDDLLAGRLDYQDFKRLPREEEEVVLRILHETLVSRAWCLRQATDGKILLTFPSYFRRERPVQPDHPNIHVTYKFNGLADDIYATLVVRLHYSGVFESDRLWRSAADFKTQMKKGLGFKLTSESEGTFRLDIYFDTGTDENSRVLFVRYVHNHLQEYAENVVRLRHYVCENKKCQVYGLPVTDRSAIDASLASNRTKIFCVRCGRGIVLRDAMEKKFESAKVVQQAQEIQSAVQQVLDNESRELILVGHAYSIVAEAGQIYRGYTNSDHGIDGEIEFKDNEGRATGKRLYLQLKSGDSYLTKRERDNAEIFYVKKDIWAKYWKAQAYPVMLVICSSRGEIRWMEVSAYLKKTAGQVKRIVFDGERFDLMSVRRWRDKLLKADGSVITGTDSDQ